MVLRDYKDDPYLSLLRPLVEAYLAFYRVGNRHIQSLGLTPGQFDVIAELEGTEGLTCAELSEKTLTTKGTLTGVLDRLEHRGLIVRAEFGGDRRATKILLTQKGLVVFERVFPVHADYMRPFFARALEVSEVRVAKQLLRRIRDSFYDPMDLSRSELGTMEDSAIGLSQTPSVLDRKVSKRKGTREKKTGQG